MRLMLARLLLVLALLAGWQAALVHPLEHIDDHGHLVHVGDGHAHDYEPSSDPAAKLCDALSALTACAVQVAIGLKFESSREKFSRYAAERLHRAEPPPFLSQGPPALL